MGEDAIYYYKLLNKAVNWRNAYLPLNQRYHLQLSGGLFRVSCGVQVVATLHNITTDIQLSNIYHLFKVYQYNPALWIAYLNESGVPTIVEACRTGYTPPFDMAEYLADGYD